MTNCQFPKNIELFGGNKISLPHEKEPHGSNIGNWELRNYQLANGQFPKNIVEHLPATK
jgi:hypothetical protein